MKNLKLISLLSFSLVSCSHYYYAPCMQNVPLFIEKNDLRLSASTGLGDETSYLELQSAYSITNHIGLMFNFMRAKGEEDNNVNNWGKGYYYEGAVGYYKPLKTFASFEVYGGFATSNQHHQYDISYRYADLTFTKIFIQPTLGYTSDVFDIALSSRISRVSFNKIDYSSYNATYNTFSELDEIANNKVSYLFEPAVTLRIGGEICKGQLQCGFSKNLTNTKLKFEKFNISAGLYFTIANRNKTQAIKKGRKNIKRNKQ
ncbi:MAG: hypothetical protein ACOYO1_06100 [Bacteroidales bacterium]